MNTTCYQVAEEVLTKNQLVKSKTLNLENLLNISFPVPHIKLKYENAEIFWIWQNFFRVWPGNPDETWQQY